MWAPLQHTPLNVWTCFKIKYFLGPSSVFPFLGVQYHLKILFRRVKTSLNIIYFTTITKQVMQFILIMLVGTDVCVRMVFVWEETGVPGWNPPVLLGTLSLQLLVNVGVFTWAFVLVVRFTVFTVFRLSGTALTTFGDVCDFLRFFEFGPIHTHRDDNNIQ